MVVHLHITKERAVQILLAVEAVCFEHVRNPAIETLDHTVGSGRSGLGQTVLNVQLLAQQVKLMVAAGLLLSTGKQTVGELLAVVAQDARDLDRTGLVQGFQENPGVAGRLAGFDLHEHPARGPVNGHEQVASLALAGHLRQVFDIHMHKARLVALEGLVRFLGPLGLEGVQVAHAVTAQAAIEPRARDLWAEKLACDRQQVIQGKQQQAAQLHRDSLLCGRQRRLQAMRRVRAVGKDLAALPLVDGLLGHAVTCRQYHRRFTAAGNLLAHCWCRAGILVQGNHHGVALPVVCIDSIKPLITARAINKG